MNKCIDCKKPVSTSKTKRCRSCARIVYWKIYRNPIKHCLDCNKIIKNFYAKRCKRCGNIFRGIEIRGKNHPSWNGGKPRCKECGAEISYTFLRCRKCELKRRIGKNHPCYINGRSKEPYPLDFSEQLKELIRIRDTYKCQKCNKSQLKEQKELKRKLPIHHIDYNKLNSSKDNLITLCNKCNTKVNSNRDYWYAYFRYIMENR